MNVAVDKNGGPAADDPCGGDLRKPPEVRGWCPGALRPMLSGDGWVLRVRPHGGRLTALQARGLAQLAARHGSGLIDLSGRANLQLRGVSQAAHPALVAGLLELGLIDARPEDEARRNILVTPFADARADALAADLADALVMAAPELPGKFGFAIDTGSVAVLAAASADIRIERAGDGLMLRADGLETGRAVTAVDAAAEAVRLAQWFLDAGGAPDGRGRMAALMASGRWPPGHDLHCPRTLVFEAQPGLVDQGVLIGLPFGQMDAQQLGHLAEFGDIRVTPWRMLLIEGLRVVPNIPGLVIGPGDPLLSVSACTGAPGCPQGLGATRAIARALAGLMPGLHVSGCAKGCAHPGVAPVTLVAAGGGRYDLVRNGRACDRPDLTDLDPEAPQFVRTVNHAASL